MAINDAGPTDKHRGSGPQKETVASPAGFDASPDALANEPADSNTPDPAGGGCLKLGWGCLPVAAFWLCLPAGLLLTH